MAKTRDIKRRIKSVQNTVKITRTMELIATAKSQVCQGRTQRAAPYFQALAEIAGEAQKAAGEDLSHPLLEEREVKKVAILAVAANRGLCGGYNTNVGRLARDRRQELLAEGKEVEIFGSGKKVLNWFRFNKVPVAPRTYTQFEDKPPFTEVEKVADHLMGLFLDGEVQRVEVVYTHYYSAGRQAPVVETVLPIAAGGAGEEEDAAEGEKAIFSIEPDPQSILDALFPLQAKLHLFRVYLEAATSEQIARRIAMKNATDNAQEVGRTLKMAYNRARQNQITKEILEVLGGSEALA